MHKPFEKSTINTELYIKVWGKAPQSYLEFSQSERFGRGEIG